MKKLLVLLITITICTITTGQTKKPILSGEKKVEMFSKHLDLRKESSLKRSEMAIYRS